MWNGNRRPEDPNSWFTWPLVDAYHASNPLQSSLDAVFLESSSYSEHSEVDVVHAMTFNVNDPLPLPRPVVPSPQDPAFSLPPKHLGQDRLDGVDRYDWNWSLRQDGHRMETPPSSFTLLPRSFPQYGSLYHRSMPPPLSEIERKLFDELVSPPTTLPQDPPPFLGEAGLPLSEPLSLSSPSRLEKPGARAPQLALEDVVSSNSGKGNPTVKRLPQRRYSSRSQSCDFLPVAIDYEDGYRLDKIKRGVAGIVNQQGVAFPGKEFAQKASFRLEVKGHQPFTAQLNVNTMSGSPTRLRFAECTVKFMETFMNKCNQKDTPFPYGLSDLLLVRIELVSEGSVQPVFDILQSA